MSFRSPEYEKEQTNISGMHALQPQMKVTRLTILVAGESKALVEHPVRGLLIVVVTIILVLLGVGMATNEISLPTKTVTVSETTTSSQNVVGTMVSRSSSGEGIYIVGVDFNGGNVTVNIGDSGGGVPIPPGYGDTGVMGQFIAAIIIQDGSVYYHYNWNCQLNTPCATAPGPYRYFTLTQKASSLNSEWNLGNNSLVPDMDSTGGSVAAGMIFPWASGRTYNIYIQNTDNSIVYQASFGAP